ncbi:MAG: oxidoreductase, partial [Gemmatimonadota bacterium]
MRFLWPPIAVFLSMAPASAHAQWTTASAATSAEFRSLHAPQAAVVWAGGRGGVVARSVDGGQRFTVDTIPTATALFIVGIHGADSTTAHALATSFDGGLARIYRTRDGGRTWEARYEDRRPGVFMDALACWDVSRCLAFGDPVDGTFVVARTTDAGESWSRLPAERLPAPLVGEAGFAASGRALVTGPDGTAWFGTGGGDRARVYRTDDYGDSWSVHDTPLPGSATAGIFALAFREDGPRGRGGGGG